MTVDGPEKTTLHVSIGILWPAKGLKKPRAKKSTRKNAGIHCECRGVKEFGRVQITLPIQ